MSKCSPRAKSGLRVYRTALQPGFVPGVWGRVNFDGINYDILDEWSGAPNYRFEPKYAGYYLIMSEIHFNPGATNIVHVEIRLNGAVILAHSSGENPLHIPGGAKVTTIEQLDDTDYIDVLAMYTPVPPATNIDAGRDLSYLAIHRLGA